MNIELVPVQEKDKSIVANLLELYEYDFSEFIGSDVDEQGKYGYQYLDFYWLEPNRRPFLIKVDGNIGGCVLVNLKVPAGDGAEVHSMVEFFVMRKYRRNGVGRHIANKIFDAFPGKWAVTQLNENKAAQIFWKNVIQEYTGGNFQVQETPNGPVLTFSN